MATDDTPDTPTPTPAELELERVQKAATDSDSPARGGHLASMPEPVIARTAEVAQEAELGGRLAALRERILKTDDVTRNPIDLSEWWPDFDGELFVTSMSGAERSRYEASMKFDASGEPRDLHNIQSKLAIRCLVDSAGNRIFGDDDVDVFASKGSAPIQKIFEAAADLNGLTKDAIQKIEKNSERTTTAM